MVLLLHRIVVNTYAGVAELADAQDLKSCCSNTVPVRFRSPASYFVRVAQLDRASGYGPEGRGFESFHVRVKTMRKAKKKSLKLCIDAKGKDFSFLFDECPLAEKKFERMILIVKKNY